MSVASVLTAIGDKLRSILGGTTKYKLDAMPAAIDQVYKKGQQAEYDRFWDEYQQNGTRTNYSYAFAGSAWTDASATPKYPIGTGSGLNINYCFYYSTYLTKTPLIKSVSWAAFSGTFQQAKALVEINIEGKIGKSFSVEHCSLLDAPSIERICSCLIATDTVQTLTFNAAAKTTYYNAHKDEYSNADEAWLALAGKYPTWNLVA